MERKNFAQVLKDAKVDIRREYERLYALCNYHDKNHISFMLYCSINFKKLPFKDTCISLEDFNNTYGFVFEETPKDFDINYLINYCEYIYNLAIYNFNSNTYASVGVNTINKQIMEINKKIGYTGITNDGVTIFVPKSQPSIVVSEMLPSDLSYKVIEYNHHSMKGDLSKKRDTLKLLADKLEADRKELKSINGSISTDLFFLLNNINIRHNNIDPASSSYKKSVAEMPNEELEKWYDKTYDLCLYAFMTLDQADRKTEIKELKERLNSNE